MKRSLYSILILVGFLIFQVQVTAQNDTTKINFKIKNFGVYVKGNFSVATITSNFDTNNLDNSYINATVTINSLSTNNTKRDTHLLGSDYFDEQNYKQLKLASTKIEKIASNTYQITGNLTIKKKTKTVVIPLKISEGEDDIIINANFELNRRDYGVGGGSWVMSNTVKIEVNHTVKK